MASTTALDLKVVPALPLVPAVFLPTAPHPKTTEDVDFAMALGPCVVDGRAEAVRPLLDQLSEARRLAVNALDASRTLTSADAIHSDTRKYLSLVKGFRGKARPATAGDDAATSSTDAHGLPTADVPNAKADGEEDAAAAAAATANETKAEAVDGAADAGAAEEKEGGAAEDKDGADATDDGTLRHMMPFVWRDLGDGAGQSFRVGDTVLEEANVLLALAQVLLQKATAEPLNEQSMLTVMNYLKQAAGVCECAVSVVEQANAPAAHLPDDLKNGLLATLVDLSLVQAQHITVRRAQMTVQTNPRITHTLIARLCHDTAERYRAMEKKVLKLCPVPEDTKKSNKAAAGQPPQLTGVAKYFMAHIRYKTLYFMALGYAMLGLQRVQQDDDVGCAFGIRNLMTASDLLDKAEQAARTFVDAARTMVYIDTTTILTQIDDCRSVCRQVMDKASNVNDTVFYKPVPEKADALPDRMSNMSAEPFPEYNASPLWTAEVYASFDPTKAPNLAIGKVPEDVECCQVS